NGQAIDLITFTQTLRDKNILETIGGASFVTSLFTFVPTAANLDYYLEIVRDKYVLRQIITTCTEGVRRAYEEQGEVGPLLDEVEHNIFKVGDDRFKGQLLTMKNGSPDQRIASSRDDRHCRPAEHGKNRLRNECGGTCRSNSKKAGRGVQFGNE
ncbi:MAG: hypothetical protein DME32_15475, partial [Verrucomicrobia bacterium]